LLVRAAARRWCLGHGQCLVGDGIVSLRTWKERSGVCKFENIRCLCTHPSDGGAVVWMTFHLVTNFLFQTCRAADMNHGQGRLPMGFLRDSRIELTPAANQGSIAKNQLLRLRKARSMSGDRSHDLMPDRTILPPTSSIVRKPPFKARHGELQEPLSVPTLDRN